MLSLHLGTLKRDGGFRLRPGKERFYTGDIPEEYILDAGDLIFCYVLCDLTDSLKDHCKKHSMTEAHDGVGFFHYKPSYNAYIKVISFDKLLQAAKGRKRGFFDELDLPAN